MDKREHIIDDCESRTREPNSATGVLAWAFKGRANESTTHICNSPEVAKKVTFRIFDGREWEVAVTFFDNPEDVVAESIAMAFETVQEAKELENS